MLWLWCILTQTACAAVLGIDYGSQFLKSSLVAPNSPFEIVLTPDSQRKDASGLVVKPDDGERVYGSAGAALISKFPESAVFYMKSLLGLPFEDPKVAEYQANYPGLKVVPTNRSTVAFELGDVVYPIEEIAAMQFNDVIARSTDLLRSKTKSRTAKVNDIAVSVPGSFGLNQRQALVDAVGLTGTTLIGLVNDGVAVALNYANSPAVSAKIGEEKHYVVVYDGGSSVTTSTLISLRLSPRDNTTIMVEVEGFGSTDKLSGMVLTHTVRDIIFSKFEAQNGQVERTGRLLGQVGREAERAKHVLSANNEVHVFIESFAKGKDLDIKITREEFEQAATESVEAAVAPIKECTQYFKGELDSVVLAGGVTRTPFVLSQLQQLVGESKISKNVNADEAITQGTSLRGVGISGIFKSKKKFQVLDRPTHTYSLLTNDNLDDPATLFSRRSFYGRDKILNITTDVEYLTLYEDEKAIARYNLSGINSTVNALHEAGTAMTCVNDETVIQAKFGLDHNGIVKLKALDAICEAVKTVKESTDSESSSTETQSETQTEAETESATESATETDSEANSEETTTEPSAKTKPKSRRVPVATYWVAPALSIRDQITLKAHLKQLNNDDLTRKEYSVLHHELESLLYRIRGFAEDDQQSIDQANAMLSWMETNKGNVTELKTKIEEAQVIYKKIISADDEDDEEVAEEEAPGLDKDESESESNESESQPDTEVDSDEQAEQAEQAEQQDINHEEL